MFPRPLTSMPRARTSRVSMLRSPSSSTQALTLAESTRRLPMVEGPASSARAPRRDARSRPLPLLSLADPDTNVESGSPGTSRERWRPGLDAAMS